MRQFILYRRSAHLHAETGHIGFHFRQLGFIEAHPVGLHRVWLSSLLRGTCGGGQRRRQDFVSGLRKNKEGGLDPELPVPTPLTDSVLIVC